jgi:hypothetical protein
MSTANGLLQLAQGYLRIVDGPTPVLDFCVFLIVPPLFILFSNDRMFNLMGYGILLLATVLLLLRIRRDARKNEARYDARKHLVDACLVSMAAEDSEVVCGGTDDELLLKTKKLAGV